MDLDDLDPVLGAGAAGARLEVLRLAADGAGEIALGLRRGQIFQELDRIILVRRGLHDTGAADVHMRAVAILVREGEGRLGGSEAIFDCTTCAAAATPTVVGAMTPTRLG